MLDEDRSLSASLPAILNGLATEMDMLVSHGMKLESSMAVLSTRARVGGEMIENLQSLDVLLQHLSELRGFITTLAEGAKESDNLSIDRALDALKLHALYSRLAEAIGGIPSRYSAPPAGDLDLL